MSENNRPPSKNAMKSLSMITGFGISFAVEVWLIGFVFGGWLDEKLAGGKGYLTMLMIVLAIAFAFISFYQLVIRLEKGDK